LKPYENKVKTVLLEYPAIRAIFYGALFVKQSSLKGFPTIGAKKIDSEHNPVEMKQTFYSNGKLLITGEYLVLDGAKAFTNKIWTKLIIEEGSNKTIMD
jgi:hypothetical protein